MFLPLHQILDSSKWATAIPKRYTLEGGGLSKSFISRVIIGATPFRALITLLRTYLLSPMPLQAGSAIDYTKRAFLKIPSPGSKL